MKTIERDGKTYKVPDILSDFQLDLHIHMINWKWENLTRNPGLYRDKPYDALLPDELRGGYLLIYPPIRERVKALKFKPHKFIDHMASSQAACINLFVPLLQYPEKAAQVLKTVKPDFHRIAIEKLDSGFQLEFWDKPDNTLNDHNQATGTDSDIAIAYYNREGKLNLWLIEHKLSEAEFTRCGGFRSIGRNKQIHRCESIAEILNNPQLCYYDSEKLYRYWQITGANPEVFPVDKLQSYGKCPFQDGLNQLWRNQLLAIAIEKSTSENWPYEKVFLSVVHHPKNQALNETMTSFEMLVGGSGRFSSFPSDMILDQAESLDFKPVQSWVNWYRELYYY